MNPIARGLRSVVRGYQHLRAGRPSPCRYQPTCSSYAIEALELHGARRGSWLALRRLLRCHPWGGHGWDPSLVDSKNLKLHNVVKAGGRLVASEPEDFGQRESFERRVAHEIPQPVFAPHALGDLAALVGGASVAPQHGRSDDCAGAI